MDGVREGDEELAQNAARLSSGRAMSLTGGWAWREGLDCDTTELQEKCRRGLRRCSKEIDRW